VGSNLLSSSAEPVSAVNSSAVGREPRGSRRSARARGRERGRAARKLALLSFFLRRALMQSHPKRGRAAVNRACGKSPGLRLAREQLVLLGPVKRQIQFGQTRRRELDGLPALQDH
jgi:hypothetical protein